MRDGWKKISGVAVGSLVQMNRHPLKVKIMQLAPSHTKRWYGRRESVGHTSSDKDGREMGSPRDHSYVRRGGVMMLFE